MDHLWAALAGVSGLDLTKSFHHGGCKELTKADTWPPFVPGSKFLCLVRENPIPPEAGSRPSGYEMYGKGDNSTITPPSMVSGFHVTKVTSLFHGTIEEAWPWQCDGRN